MSSSLSSAVDGFRPILIAYGEKLSLTWGPLKLIIIYQIIINGNLTIFSGTRNVLQHRALKLPTLLISSKMVLRQIKIGKRYTAQNFSMNVLASQLISLLGEDIT